MNLLEEEYEPVFETLTGMRMPSDSLAWVEDISEEGTDYASACEQLWKARENLAARFCLSSEDEDLEAVMDAVSRVEKEIARYMFRCGIRYARESGA